MVSDVFEAHRRLRKWQEAVLHAGDGHARPGVGVDDAADIVSRSVHGAVDDVSGFVQSIFGIRIVQDLALDVYLYQAGGGDLFIHQTVRINQDLVARTRDASGDVVVDKVTHPE